ncbi:MAG: glucan biosynthesis protein [Hyphomicrobiales bacterium]|nr:glucan biosynthesis protein [Hyphomicrobiales bacterium]
MIVRRDVLKFAAGAVNLAAGAAVLAPGAARAENAPAPPAAQTPFQSSGVLDLARALAKGPYQAQPSALPDPFSNLTYEQYVGIRRKAQALVWSADNVGFAIEPLHRGFIFATPMQINVVENGLARRIGYQADDFEFGALKAPTKVGDLGFSGFRVLQIRDGKTAEVAIFQGASFFKAHAPGQAYGVTARGLAIKTGDPRGEEFPVFKAVWIEKPTLAENALVIHAVLDSESLAGAYRFTLRPGEATMIDTELTLVPRVNVDHIGVAPMSATCLTSPLAQRRTDDVRPTIAEAGGLQMLSGKDEWIWRPIANRAQLQLSSFVDENPKGFGFLQRNRDFTAYQDDDLKWQDRPSLWIEPLSDFGAGGVSLVEIPTDSELNSNCIAYWRPNAGLTQGKEAAYAYRQFWCWDPPNRPKAAYIADSRGGKTPGAKRRRFIVAFMGDALGPNTPPNLKPQLSVAPGTIASVRTFHYPDAKTYRVLFDIDPGETASELRLALESDGKPISETWLYRWTP